jgi:hypothetical protein
MSKIIVSYRRSDSQAASGRIADRLVAHFGADSVFMDIDNIPFGIDFRQHIRSALSQADVLLAIVGPGWLGVNADGRSRLQESNDPVRVEIETALVEKLRVIPVLVNGANMPNAAALPDSLKDFSFLNAAPVDVGRDFHPHVERLIKSIDDVMARKTVRPSSGASAAIPAPQRTSSNRWFIAIAVTLLIVAGGAAWQLRSSLVPGIAPAPIAAVVPPTQLTSEVRPLSNPEPSPIALSPSIRGQPTPPSADEIQWSLVKDTSDIGLLRRFVELNPDSKHREDAEQRIAALAALLPPVPQVLGRDQIQTSTPVDSPGTMTPATPPAGTPVATLVPQGQGHVETPPPPLPAATSGGQFDGIWLTDVVCEKRGDVLGWSKQCVGKIKNRVFHCEFGTAEQPG